MNPPLSDILARLAAAPEWACEYDAGTAWFADENEYGRQGELFDAAVQTLTAARGEPPTGRFTFPGLDVEKVACWPVGGRVVYVRLTFEDNTRIRRLALGVCRVGDVVAVPDDSPDWSAGG